MGIALEVIFTEEQLCSKCAEWQKILRLQDWDVETSIVRQRIMPGNNGECEYYSELKHAFIRILDPIDYHDPLPQDMEWILVHELLHLHFAPFWDDAKESELETAINQMANVLIRMNRRG